MEEILREREQCLRNLEDGATTLIYRGWYIDVEDDDDGWTYQFDGEDYPEPLEEGGESWDAWIAEHRGGVCQNSPGMQRPAWHKVGF